MHSQHASEAPNSKLTAEEQWSKVTAAIKSYLYDPRIAAVEYEGLTKGTSLATASYEDVLAACESYRTHSGRKGPFATSAHLEDKLAFGFLDHFVSVPTLSDIVKKVDTDMTGKWVSEVNEAHDKLSEYEQARNHHRMKAHLENLTTLMAAGTDLVNHYNRGLSFLEDETFQTSLTTDLDRDPADQAIQKWTKIVDYDLQPTVDACEEDLKSKLAALHD